MSTNALVIYKSSAGSGKTYTLVLEYLKLVLKRPALYRSILAITFTNKATEEMKTRIIGSLVEIADNKNQPLQEAISLETGISIQELPEKASRVLDNILHDYSGFAVSTIDSFFSTMVRALARELNLPLRFDIELNTDSVIREITDQMLDDTGTNNWLKKWLQDFIFDKLDQGKSWKIEDEIHNMARELFKESYREMFAAGHSKPDAEFVKELRSLVSGFESKMTGIGNEFLKIMDENKLEIQDFAYGKGGVVSYFIKITRKIKTVEYIPGKRFMDVIDDATDWPAKKSPYQEQIIALAGSDFIPLAKKILTLIKTDLPSYAGAKILLNTIHLSGIYSLLDEKLQKFRDENEIVLISDTNHLLQKSISGQDAPFIYEKTGNRFSHFMLDEFQDTSDYQWKNLLPLIENSLGSGNYAMIVGDAKQSIYRWRGGNMQLLISGVQQQLKHFNSITSIKTLGDNYRSRKHIIDFNNKFFELAPGFLLPGKENESLRIAYAPADLHQNWKKGTVDEGYIQIRIVDPIPIGSKKDTSEVPSNETDQDEKWIQKACKENLAILNKVLELGFEFSDIAFLTRTNNDAKAITTFLIENGIHRIISPESMQLNRSPKIQFLINLLEFINDQQNDIILAEIVYYWNVIRKNDSSHTIHELLAAKSHKKMEWLPKEFAGKLITLRKIPLYEAVEELSIIFELGSPPEAYFQRFLDVVIEYSRRNPANITDFLIWWDENQDKESCSVVIPSGENAIRVMSIHKSKGLQFPVVIMPFVNWELKPKTGSTMWVRSDQPPFNKAVAHPVKVTEDLQYSVFANDYLSEVNKNYADNLNLLYVAFTRAEEQLYVVTAPIPASREKDDSSISKRASELIVNTLKNHIEFRPLLNEYAGIFEKGNCLPPLRKPKSENKNDKTLLHWFSTSWKQRLKLGISKKKISIYDPETPEIQYGILFHKLASEINSVVNPETFVKTHDATKDMDSTAQQRLIGEIQMLVDAASNNGWFQSEMEHVNEAELLLPDGTMLRPDRLIIKGTNAVVVDYKTGVEEKHHAGQVKQYASVLQQMGFTEIKMFLVYPAIKKVVEVV